MAHTARPRLAILFAALAALFLCLTGPPAQAQGGSVPEKPTGLSSEASHDSVSLTWDDPGDDSITHYQVFRRDRDVHAAGEFVTITENTGSAATGYTDDTVEPERRYVYRVKAVNAHGASTWSGYRRASTPAAPAPDPTPTPTPTPDPADLAPSGLTAEPARGRGVALRWTAPAEDAASVTGYEVLRAQGKAELTTLADTDSTDTTYTDETATAAGETYAYQVKALRGEEKSQGSNYAVAGIPAVRERNDPPIAVRQSGMTKVLPSWSLIPSGVGPGDQFRLMFLTTNRDARPTDIDVYNEWVQGRAAGGHDDVRYYAETFKALGCTAADDARDNTGTTHTNDDKGVPIYWLNGPKVADEYDDLYDGDWDEEAKMRTRGGSERNNPQYVWTGCNHNGTKYSGAHLGSTEPLLGRPNTSDGPLSSSNVLHKANDLNLYALSDVFETAFPSYAVWSATLTVGTESATPDDFYGFMGSTGDLDPDNFIYDTSTVTVTELGYRGDTAYFDIGSGKDALGSGEFSLYVGGTYLRISNPAADSDGRLTLQDHGLSWSAGDTVVVFLTENQEASGEPTIIGAPQVGERLSADTSSGITDPNNSPPTADGFSYQWILVDGGVETDVPGATASIYWPSPADVGKRLKLKVSFTDDAGFDEEVTSEATNPVAPVAVTWVSSDWSLIPDGLGAGDQFRLLFVSSDDRKAGASDIDDYNDWIQQQVADNGHAGIQGYNGLFRAVGSTNDVDARDNTGTRFTAGETGVPIYWLNGAQVADDYEDFYDGDWDDEVDVRDETGAAPTSIGRVWTGSDHDGTEQFTNGASRALGNSGGAWVRQGSLNSASGGPLSRDTADRNSNNEMYGLSGVFRVADAPVVPLDWGLLPSRLSEGDQFRLLFLSSETRTAESTDIADYNTWVQALAGAGHTDIQGYRPYFRVVGSTADVDARDNTGTTFTDADTGVPIYWLNGSKAADHYRDFYNGNWDQEASMRDEAGTIVFTFHPWTGSKHDGTEAFSSGDSRALGAASVRRGQPNSTVAGSGPLSSNSDASASEVGKFYALSDVFEVFTNSRPTAGPTISGFPQLGMTLTADASTIVDPDGTSGASFSYQWVRSEAGTDSEISGATATSYTLVEADVGTLIKVTVSYSDGEDMAETATSEPLGPVGRVVIDSAGNVDARGVWLESAAAGGFIIRLSDDEDDRVYGYTTGPLTHSPAHGFDLHADNGDATGIAAADGVLWVADRGDDQLFAYNVGASGTFGARLTAKEFDLHADNQRPAGVWTDGETLYVADPDEAKLFAYRVGAGGTFGESLADQDVALHADNDAPWGVWSTGTVIWVADRSDDFIYAYSLSAGGARLDAVALRWEWPLDTADGNTDPWGMWSDDDRLWVLDDGRSKLFAYYLPLPSAPDPPAAVAISGDGVGELTVEWEAPGDDGGSAISGYTVQWKSGAESFDSSREGTAAATARSQTIPNLTNDTEYTLRVQATNANGGSDWAETTGTPRAAAVSITGDTEFVREGTAAAFTLSRTGPAAAALTVSVLVTQEGSFIDGTLPTSVTIAAGDAEAPLRIATEDDDLGEDDGSIKVTITGVSSAIAISQTAGSATVAVRDDSDLKAKVSVDVESLTFAESVGTVTLKYAARMEPNVSPFAFAVSVLTDRGTARTLDGDFEGFSEHVTVAATDFQIENGQQVAHKTVDITINNNHAGRWEGDETFDFLVQRAPGTPGSVLVVDGDGNNAVGGATTTITIADNDAAPSLDMSVSPSLVEEGDSATLTVTIADGSAFAADQTIALTFSGTATRDVDYTADLATADVDALTLAAGLTEVAATVTVLDDAIDDDTGETIVIEAAHAGTSFSETYTLTIGVASLASDTALSALVLNDGTDDLTLTPAFASGTTSYAASVGNAVAQITVTPAKRDTDASLEYLDADDATISDADGMTAGQQVDLIEGENTIKVKVTAEDDATTETYTVVVTRAQRCDGTQLWCETMTVGTGAGTILGWSASGIVIAGGSLGGGDQDFDYGTHTYSFAIIFLSGTTLGIEFGAGAAGDLASTRTRDKLVFTVDGQAFGLGAGNLAANGRGVNWTSTGLTWMAGGTVDLEVVEAAVSTDAALSDLSLSDGTLAPAFASDTNTYTVGVANSVETITLTPAASHSWASVEYLDASDLPITDADGMTDGQQVALVVGANTIKVKVTAEDDATTQTYTLTVTRAVAGAATEATLSDLVLDDGTSELALTPAFASGTTSYTRWVGNGIDQITVTPETSDANASVEYLDAGDATISDADTMTTGQQIDLIEGENTIKVKVTAEDDATTETYTVVVTRAAPAASTDATLSGLVLNDGANDLTLTPAFASGTTSYAASVGNAVSQITVTPTKSDTDASVEYLDASDGAITDADGMTAGQQVALVEGANTIKVKVTAEDVITTETYTVVVTRAAPAASTDATLVSNEDATAGTGNSSVIHAQSFVTGTNAGGYTLSEIQIRLGDSSAVPGVTGVIAAVKADDSGAPGALVANLVNPGSLTADAFNAFTAPAGTTLSANTTYWVVINEERSSNSDRVRLFSTADDDEDIALTGWSIGDGRLWKSNASDASWNTSADSNLIIVKGTVKGGATNNAPVFADATTTRSVPENSAVGTNVGSAVTATDADSDTLEYTLEGTDAASFTIVSTSGQIQTKTGVTYNHEGTSSYSVTVKADDGNGGTDTIGVTVTVSDVNEVPSAPEAPDVTAASGTTDSLVVDWKEPANTGPAITDYDVQYRKGNSGAFTAWSHTDATTSATITGLEASTSYQVQVKARNDEGASAWSASGTGSTGSPASDAALTALVLNDGANDLTLTPTFASGTTSYAASVGNGIDQITVTPEKSDTDASVEYLDASDGAISDADGSASGQQVALDVGANTIKVKVTAEDATTTQTYTVVVTRAAPAASTDAALSGLVLNDGANDLTLTPAFASGTTSYAASVGNGIDQITVTPTKSDTNASLEYLDANGAIISDADGSASGQQVALDVGANTIKVKVTAEDATTTQTYTVVVTRAAPAASTDAALSGLVLNDGANDLTLTPAFASGTTSYAASVGNGIDQITVTPTKSDTNASLEYLDANGAIISDADGSASGQQVALEVGANTIKVKVTAEDATTTETYTVVVTRAAPAASTDAALSGLVLNGGANDLTLTPAFASGTTSYAASVGNGIDQITVTPTKSDTNASLEYLDANGAIISDADGSASGQQVALEVGANTIKVKVTAEDATTTGTYTVVVTRAAPAASTDAALSGLVLNDGTNDLTLTPAFASGTTSYAASVGNGIDQITVTPEKSDTDASVEYLDGNDAAISDADGSAAGQQVALDVGANTIKVMVTAEDATTTETYTVVVTRAMAGPVAPLPRPDTLVSNIGKANTGIAPLDAYDFTQEFTTGDNSDGYTLTSVDIEFGQVEEARITYAVSIREDKTGEPGRKIERLTDPARLSANALNTYTTSGIALAANTTYFVLVNSSTTHTTYLRYTSSDAEDSGAASDWTIGDASLLRFQHGGTWGTSSETIKIRINGTVTGADATLSGLALHDGANELTLTPTFSSGTTSYAASVGDAVSQITVTPTKSDADASVEYLDASDGAISDADGMASGQQVALVLGANTIKLRVTAADAMTTVTYTVVVTRAATASSDATLSGLLLNDGANELTLTPSFASGTTSYAASVGNAVSRITVTPEKSHTDASLEYLDGNDAAISDADGAASGQQVALVVGANTIKVEVTAADAMTTVTYTIVVTRTTGPGTEPGPPTNVQASGNAELGVTWDAPDDGGSAISGYTLQWKSGAESYSTTRQATVTTTTHTIPALTNGTTYTVRVKATNTHGDSGWTEITATPGSGAGVASVTVDQASITQTSADVIVTVENLQGVGHTVYVRYREAGANWPGSANLLLATSGTAITVTLAGLSGNTDYDVAASLDSGIAPGVRTASFTTLRTKPGKTRAVNVTFEGDGQFSIGWTQPENDGGSPITGYQVQWKSGSQSFGGDPSREDTTGASPRTYVVTGLTNGTAYTVRVIAVNAVGDGPPSDEQTATPVVGKPDAPGNVQALSGNAELTVTWDGPYDGGSAITEYTLQWKSGNQSFGGDPSREDTTGASPRTYVVTGLANGTQYAVRVKATNTNGDSGWSVEATGTPRSSITTGGGGGGGGGGPSGPSPSELDFEWNVKRDLEALDGGHDTPTGSWSDGTVLWIAENGPGAGDAVYAYDLQTGERVEEREFELDERNRAPRGVWSDGETVWVSDSGQDRLFGHDLETGERLPERDLELDEDNGAARGIWSDGERMWVLDGGKDSLFAYDLGSGALVAEYALDDANGDPHGIWSDGVTIWVSDHGAKRLFAYRLDDGALVRNSEEEFTELSKASNNSPRGIWSDGEVIYVADESDDKVYSYNMPDAIDARLASLTLSGIEIGEFSGDRTEYDGVAAEGVTETTVEAEALQRRTTVLIEPADAGGDDTNGHQLALEGIDAITVTVTSADGSRTRVYRVRLEGGAAQEAPWTHCLRGDIAEGFSLVVYEGGGVEELVTCAESRDVVALYALHGGEFVSYILGAPEFVNQPFVELFADGVPPVTPLVAGSSGPPSTDPNLGDGALLPWPECLRGEIAAGFSLVIYEGGSVDDLVACAQSLAVTALYALHDGEFVPYILGAPDFVNRDFRELFADGLPAIAALVARSEGHP